MCRSSLELVFYGHCSRCVNAMLCAMMGNMEKFAMT